VTSVGEEKEKATQFNPHSCVFLTFTCDNHTTYETLIDEAYIWTQVALIGVCLDKQLI